MNLRDSLLLLASYNQWMNKKLYSAAFLVDPSELYVDKGAYFGSILKTLFHVNETDAMWLSRLSLLGSIPNHLRKELECVLSTNVDDEPEMDALQPLWARRRLLDQQIGELVRAINDAELSAGIAYASDAGLLHQKRVAGILLHLFNHQAHHRGQITTLYAQMGMETDFGESDLVTVVP